MAVILATIFQKTLPKVHFTCPQKHFTEKKSFRKVYSSLYHIRSLNQRNRDFGRKTLLSCQNSFNRVQQKSLWKELANSTLLVPRSDFIKKNFKKFIEETSAVLSKVPVSWSDATFARKTIFPKTTTFLSCSGFEQNLSDTNLKISGRFVNTTFWVSRGKFWGKRTFFWEVSSLINFELWAVSICNFAAELTVVIAKMHFLCPMEFFDDLFLKLFNFFHIFEASSGKFPNFWLENFCQGCRRWEKK